MKALQMHYTSCRHGLSGHAGFQTRALSEGLRPEERRELERRGGYRPPRTAPAVPSPEELANEFPVAFRGGRLESGRPALIRSCYTGRDYSGRWGNFFAHSLVLDENAPRLWPIDLYEWPGWSTGFSADDEAEAPPEPLPKVELSDVPPAESFRLREISEFLREETGRPELLSRMGRAVLLGAESSRPVVIRADPLDGLFWIAAVQKLFPPRVAWRISFSTYQDDPRGCSRLNVTTDGTGFRLDEADRKYRFYVFDLVDAVHSEVPGAEDDYPAVAAKWLAERPDRHEELTRFVDLFDEGMPDSKLNSVLDLLRFTGDETFSCSDERFAEAVEVVSAWVTPANRSRLLDALARAACRDGRAGFSTSAALARFLADEAKGGDPVAGRRVLDVWWAFVRSSWRGGEPVESQVDEFWRIVLPLFADAPGALAELLAAVIAPGLNERDPSVPVATALLRIVLSSAGGPGKSADGRALAWSLVDVLGRAEALEPALSAVKADHRALVDVAYRLLDTGLDSRGGWDSEAGLEYQRRVGETLASVLARVPAERAWEIRRRLAADGRWEVLFGEWSGYLAGGSSARNRYRSYRTEILEGFPAYRESRGSSIAESLLDRLDEQDAREQAVEWLEGSVFDGFDRDLAVRCTRLANEAVPVVAGERGDAHLDRLAAAVQQAAERLSIELDPDRPFLHLSSKALRATKIPAGRQDRHSLHRIGRELGRLPAGEAKEFLTATLPRALGRARSEEEHRNVLTALVPEVRATSATEGYRVFLGGGDGLWPKPLQAALRFWLQLDLAEAGSEHLEGLRKTAHEGFVRRLVGLSEPLFAQIQEDIRDVIIDEPAAGRWRKIEAAIERKRQPLLRRVLSALRPRRRG